MAKQDPDQWTESDAVKLRAFLSECPKFKDIMRARLPKIDGATVESRAMTGSDVKGYLEALDTIDNLKRGASFQNEGAQFIDTDTDQS